jgi:hypothetical protein
VSTYAPGSSLGWLDLDTAASERVGTLLRSLEEPGTLDPLGLGSVRDAFSAILSPGTSTIQTRLRYFIFLPWIFARLESLRVPPNEFARRLRDSEARLIDCLRHLGPNQGTIGYDAGRDVKRLPSESYWGGLGSWGLRRLDLSLAEYGQRAATLGRMRAERDDDGNAVVRSVAMWAVVPAPPDHFLDAEITFDLRRSEAEVITDHIQGRHPRSLLAAMCNNPDAAADADYPWDVPTAGLSDHLIGVLHHAQCFSELTVGPQHVYNILLARQARSELGWDTDDLEARETHRLDVWVDLIGNRYQELNAWVREIDAFWAFLAPYASISTRTQDFVGSMVTRAVQNPAGFADDPMIHGKVRDREMLLKAQRARLVHRSALERWNQVPFGAQLSYRWPITRSYLSDIAAGTRARN